MRDNQGDDRREFSIRDLCDEFEVTPRALRFYESEGLLSPQRAGQRRIYGQRDRARLKLILRGKRFGFTLAEIGGLLDLYDLGDGQVTQLERTLATAYEKRAELVDKQRALEAATAELDEQIDLVERLLQERRSQHRSEPTQTDRHAAL